MVIGHGLLLALLLAVGCGPGRIEVFERDRWDGGPTWPDGGPAPDGGTTWPDGGTAADGGTTWPDGGCDPTGPLGQEACLMLQGYPNEEELAIHYLSNQLRTGYQNCGRPDLACPTAPAMEPLDFDLSLNVVARFHGRHLEELGCFQHDACCKLEKVGGEVRCDAFGSVCPLDGGPCDYDPECPGTELWDRCTLFGTSCSGENIAGGYDDPKAVVCGLLDSPGHRENLCRDWFSSLGTGYHTGSNCYREYAVQNFGTRAGSGRRIVSGALLRRPSPHFGATYYDELAGNDGPRKARVVLDGHCLDLGLIAGGPRHGVYESTAVTLGGGCHGYWFFFVDPRGQTATYPLAGEFRFGGGSCGTYSQARQPADCQD